MSSRGEQSNNTIRNVEHTREYCKDGPPPSSSPEGVKVELPDQRLESVMAEVLRQGFGLQAF
jgi:hypothetical protein